MKKAKLFMMLALLVMGVSNAWSEEWTDGPLKFSTSYNETGSTSTELPDGQVAVSLNLNITEEVTDTVMYYPTNIAYNGYGFYYTSGYTPKIVNGKGATLNYNRKGVTTTALDDDRDNVNENATYTYLGRLDYEDDFDYIYTYWDGSTRGYEYNYYFTRRHNVNLSKATQITIPSTVTHNGKTYTVTAIQKFGFCYAKNNQHDREYCDKFNWTGHGDRKTVTGTEHSNINDHSNDYLTSVTLPNTIKRIGDYAFMSCLKLTGFTIPNSVEYMGEGIFECCTKLQNVTFQTLEDGTTKIETIKNYTFWYCTGLTSLELPDGIKHIEGTSSGAPLQYLFSLTRIRLPNTLKTIGPHFLCCAKSLTQLTFPASVTDIDGACFHGCESLEEVYLLGPASTLIKETDGGTTFDANYTYCGQHVNTCKFYVLDKYYDGYKNDNVWSEIDEGGNTKNGHYGNWLIPVSEVTREFTNKWVTAIFPRGVKNYKSVFGANARVATMTSARAESGTDPDTGAITLYNLTFTLISGNDIPPATPVMICPAIEGNDGKVTVTLYDASDEADPNFIAEETEPHSVPVTADDGALITMNGQYVPYELHVWDFYFMYKNKTVDSNGNPTYTDPNEVAKFYRIPDDNTKVQVGRCRCYWTVKVDGVRSNAQVAPAKSSRFFWDETNGINKVETRLALDGIYDLNGHKLDINPEDLPQGLFIVNGKKVMKK